MTAELSRRERQVLKLRAHGMPYCTIAATLGVAASTVRNHLTRARSRLGPELLSPMLEALRQEPVEGGPMLRQGKPVPRVPGWPETAEGALARRLYRAAFDAPRAPSSQEYQRGAREMLIAFATRSVLPPCPYALGGARADAWYAGTREGSAIWRKHREALDAAAAHTELLEAVHG